VLGTFGVERHLAVFTGQTAHAGATPMELRRDTFMATSQAALAIREDTQSDNIARQTAELRRISVALFGDKHEDGPESLFKMVSGLSFQIEQVGHRVNGIDEQMKLDGAKWAFVRAGASAAWGAMRGPVGRWVMLAAGGSALGGLVYRILEIVGAMK
jgi:hypothetical protein